MIPPPRVPRALGGPPARAPDRCCPPVLSMALGKVLGALLVCRLDLPQPPLADPAQGWVSRASPGTGHRRDWQPLTSSPPRPPPPPLRCTHAPPPPGLSTPPLRTPHHAARLGHPPLPPFPPFLMRPAASPHLSDSPCASSFSMISCSRWSCCAFFSRSAARRAAARCLRDSSTATSRYAVPATRTRARVRGHRPGNGSHHAYALRRAPLQRPCQVRASGPRRTRRAGHAQEIRTAVGFGEWTHGGATVRHRRCSMKLEAGIC
jgi:hypothetical protein